MFKDFEKLTAKLKIKLDNVEREIFKDWQPKTKCDSNVFGIIISSDYDFKISNCVISNNTIDLQT